MKVNINDIILPECEINYNRVEYLKADILRGRACTIWVTKELVASSEVEEVLAYKALGYTEIEVIPYIGEELWLEAYGKRHTN
jgi:hypothetical protein